MRELVVLAHVPTDAISMGFLPAAKALGLAVTLVTDCAEAHRAHFANAGLPAYPDEILCCDVFNPLAVLDLLTQRNGRPAAVFSNSDHLQTSTAMVADYFGLPRKHWHTAYLAKNKAEMRSRLNALAIDTLWHATVCNQEALADLADLPFPVVAKPREGVASLQVTLARDAKELCQQCDMVWMEHPGRPILVEEYIEGPLHTLETIGDGQRLAILGGFQVDLSPPPNFIEFSATWQPVSALDMHATTVLETIRALGVNFGACHTEYVLTPRGPRLIEINYRNIGDYREFLLQDTLGIPLFQTVLRLYLGEPLPQFTLSEHAAQIRYFVAAEAGTVEQAPVAFIENDDSTQISYQPLRVVRDTFALTHSNKDYLGVLRGCGADATVLAIAMDRAAQRLSWEIRP